MRGRHFFIPLSDEDLHHYASCNILNDERLLHVYLLHPRKGSLLFTLQLDEETMEYRQRFIVPGLDRETVHRINERMQDGDSAQLKIFEKNYTLLQSGADYGYFVINRLFAKTADSIAPTGKFHIFFEGWKDFGEGEWEEHDGVLENIKGLQLKKEQLHLISEAVKEMNRR